MLRSQINRFRQKDNESRFEAWERYTDMLGIFPHHGLEPWLIIHTFYDGHSYNTKLNLDAAAGGAIMDKPYGEAYQLIEIMEKNHYQWGGERTSIEKPQPKGGMYEFSGIDHVNAKVDALTQKIESLTITPMATLAAVAPSCDICGVPRHNVSECQTLVGISLDQLNYAQGNPGCKNHPHFSYKNNNALYAPNQPPPGYQKPTHSAPQAAPQTPRKSNLELMMENFVASQTQQNKEFMNQNVHTSKLVKQLATKVDALDTHNKMLETQISQVAQLLQL